MKTYFSPRLLLLFIFSAFVFSVTAQTSYTWDGSTDTDFATADNWTPSGVPGSGDNITIVSVTNQPILDGNRTVNNLTMTSGTLGLAGYDLTVNGAATLNSGTITNGSYLMTTGSVTFAGTTMDCEVNVDASINSINSTTFNERTELVFEKTSTVTGGGNVFADSAFITRPVAYLLSMGVNYPDTFFNYVEFNIDANTSINIAHNSTGNYFADEVVLNNHSGNTANGFYFPGQSFGSADVAGHIIMEVDSSSGLITLGNGTLNHDGQLLEGVGGYHSGVLTLRDYVQSGATAIDLSFMNHNATLNLYAGLTLEGDLTGPSVYTTIGSGCTFNGDVDLPYIYAWSGSRFNGKADLTVTRTGVTVSTGGNYFADSTNITRTTKFLSMGVTVPDTMMGPASFIIQGDANLYLANNTSGNYFADDVSLSNETGSSSSTLNLSGLSTGSAYVGGDITLEVVSGSGNTTLGTGTLEHAGLLYIGSSGFHAGALNLKKYTQTANGTIDLSDMDGTSSLSVQTEADITADFVYAGTGNAMLSSATFRGDVSIESPSLPVTGCEFFGTTHLEKTGATNNLNGDNIFHGPTTIENSSSANYQYWGSGTADVFYEDLTLINHCSQPLWMNYNTEGHYARDISLEGDASKVIRFGNTSSGWKAVFDGYFEQEISIESDIDVQFYRLEINKPYNKVILNNDITVDYELTLTKGVILCKDNAVVTLEDGVEPSASDASYIEGFVEKVGNDAFSFPVGKNGYYRPITISAPSSTTDAFQARYYDASADPLYDHTSKDGSLNYLSTNEYWGLTRENGTSTPTVTIGWDEATSATMSLPLSGISVAGWDGSNWDDLGNGGTTGDVDNGTIVTNSGVSDFNAFTLAHDSTFSTTDCHLAQHLEGEDCTTFTLTDSLTWFSFIADSSSAVLTQRYSYPDSTGFAAVQRIEIFTDCEEETLLSTSELGTSPADSLGMQLAVADLILGETYVIKVEKTSGFDTTDISLCLTRGGGRAFPTFPWPIPTIPYGCSKTDPCNLVPNPSFESTDTQHGGLPLCGPIILPEPQNHALCYWFALSGTPDNYNTACNSASNNSYDINQSPGTNLADPSGGNDYVGIVTASDRPQDNWREYITTQLDEPLSEDHCYWVEYKTANHGIGTQNGLVSICPQASFTVGSLPLFAGWLQQQPSLGNILEPSTTNDYDVFYCDDGWNTINGFYTADGGETYISLGNFYDDTNSEIDDNTGCAQAYGSGYYQYARYLLDDIKVIDLLNQEDQTVTCFDAVSLGCTAVSGLTYLWTCNSATGLDGVSDPTASQITVHPVEPTTYTLTVTHTASSTTCQSSVVIDIIGYNLIEGPEIICDGPTGTYEFTASTTVGTISTDVEWTLPNGGTGFTVSYSGSNDEVLTITEIPTSPTNYYLQGFVICAHIKVADCVSDVCFYVEPCCAKLDVDYNLVNLSASEINGVYSGLVSGGQITNDVVIDGTLTIDQDLAFVGGGMGSEVNVYMGPMAQIDVLPGYEFGLDWAIVQHGCSEAWYRIYGHTDGSDYSVITIEDSEIRDGSQAIYAKGDGNNQPQVTITGSKFDANVNHLRFVDGNYASSATVPSNHPSSILETTFDCSYALVSNYLGINQTDTAIYTKNGTFQLNDENDPDNTIENCHRGLVSYESDELFVYDNTFTDIREDGDFASFGSSGMAVWLRENGISLLDGNTFTNSDQGIWMRKCGDATIHDNDFDGMNDPQTSSWNNRSVGTAIDVRRFQSGSTVLIDYNEIINSSIGIRFGESWGGMDMTVDHNTFDYPSDAYNIVVNGNLEALGIHCLQIGPSNNIWPDVSVTNNVLTNTIWGIWMQDLHGSHTAAGGGLYNLGFVVSENQVDLFHHPWGADIRGIQTHWSTGVAIDHNEVFSSNGPQWYQTGIETSECTEFNLVSCNEVYSVSDAFRFDLSNTWTVFAKNEMYGVDANGSGVRFNWGRIGPQGSTTNSNDNEWQDNNGISGNCWPTGASAGAGLLTIGWNLAGDWLVVQDECSFTPLNNSEVNGTQMSVLAIGTGWTGADCPIAENFQLDSAASVSERIDIYKAGLELDTTDSYRVQSLNWMQELNMFTLLIMDTATVNNDTILENYRDSCAASAMGHIFWALRAITDTSLYGAKGGLGAYADTLDVLSSYYPSEGYMRMGLSKLLRWYDSGTLTDESEEWLRAMADSCPYDAGAMVYIARSAILSVDTFPTWTENDCEQKDEPPSSRMGSDDESQWEEPAAENGISLKVYPNPNNGEFTLAFSNCGDTETFYGVTVSDITGKTVFNGSMFCGQQRLNLGNLDSGNYLLRVVSSNGSERWHYKLLIMH